MRDRASAVILQDNKVVLIKRTINNSVYYVFPGGGIDKGESPEEATKREAFEELGVIINVKKCLEKVEYKGTQYFYLADILEGVIGTGQGDEYTDLNRNRGKYEPVWLEISKLSFIDIRPIKVAESIQSITKF
ncbi:NUDIX hydrolase [Sutcliffiella halmapala]|uniref:NUDIX hydrolase n=1 Tax=Sutcliffiella halmapala TaxID=79882 RepID=UPI000995B2C1|nr:NUDIX domain-containing protein [Sutcliffiella halmapala]